MNIFLIIVGKTKLSEGKNSCVIGIKDNFQCAENYMKEYASLFYNKYAPDKCLEIIEHSAAVDIKELCFNIEYPSYLQEQLCKSTNYVSMPNELKLYHLHFSIVEVKIN